MSFAHMDRLARRSEINKFWRGVLIVLAGLLVGILYLIFRG